MYRAGNVGNGKEIFEVCGDSGSDVKGNAIGMAISHVGDL